MKKQTKEQLIAYHKKRNRKPLSSIQIEITEQARGFELGQEVTVSGIGHIGGLPDPFDGFIYYIDQSGCMVSPYQWSDGAIYCDDDQITTKEAT